ncbi:TPA: SMI1/KNR4 family protein [Vibrio cholerae]|nr:SMI1/KNR4 family protein [Vibrio cholerae]
MSYENLVKIMESSGGEIECSSPVTEKTICEFERGLNVKFPESYRQFLKMFGFLSFDREEFYGVTPSGINAKSIPSVYFATVAILHRMV